MYAEFIMAKTTRDEGLNLTTALVLLIMLLVVIVSLLTYMLYETQSGITKKAQADQDKIYCVPVSITPVP